MLDDNTLWTQLISTVKPLKQTKIKYIPLKLKVKRKEINIKYVLDLHGYTVQEAYKEVIKFIQTHYKLKTSYIIIITGKGIPNKEGLIHKEILNWLNTNILNSYIKAFEWINNNGALKIYLKREK